MPADFDTERKMPEDREVYNTLQHFSTTEAEEKAYFKLCREKMQLACDFFEECIGKAQAVAKTGRDLIKGAEALDQKAKLYLKAVDTALNELEDPAAFLLKLH